MCPKMETTAIVLRIIQLEERWNERLESGGWIIAQYYTVRYMHARAMTQPGFVSSSAVYGEQLDDVISLQPRHPSPNIIITLNSDSASLYYLDRFDPRSTRGRPVYEMLPLSHLIRAWAGEWRSPQRLLRSQAKIKYGDATHLHNVKPFAQLKEARNSRDSSFPAWRNRILKTPTRRDPAQTSLSLTLTLAHSLAP